MGSSPTSCTVRPARLTERITFCTEVTAAVTTCTSTSSRTPDMPSGSRTPSASSTMNVCGSTWMISRSWEMLIARAASTPRSTSAWLTSRSFPDTATTPRKPHLVLDPEIDAAHVLRRPLRQHALEPREALVPVLRAQPHLDAVDGVEDGTLGAAHVDLRDLRGQRVARAEQGADQRHRRARLGPRRRAHRRQLLLREAADHGGAGDDGAPLLAQHAAVLVHPVQPRGVHARERAPLFDDDRHAVRQLANDVGAADLRQRGDARGDGAAVEGPEVRAGRDGGGGKDARHRDARGPAHLDAGDREARRRGDPARPRQRRRDPAEHQDGDGGPPREPCEGAGPPAPARGAGALAGDERRAHAEG